nr:replication protein A 70 kDa DNA-binding subunit A [Tanacetum cinerariifolium]
MIRSLLGRLMAKIASNLNRHSTHKVVWTTESKILTVVKARVTAKGDLPHYKECDYKYLLQWQVQDHTGLTWVTDFQEAREEILGCSTIYLKSQVHDDERFSNADKSHLFAKHATSPKPAIWPSVPSDASSEVLAKEKVLNAGNNMLQLMEEVSSLVRLRALILNGVDISKKTLLHLLSSCPSLRSFSMLPMDHNYGEGNDTLADLLKCLPVLEHFTINGWAIERDLKDANAGKDYSDNWLEHLNELEIGNFANLKVELKFVKLILAKSPVLK